MKYRIHQWVGAFEPGAIVPAAQFPEGADFDRLIRLGAIEPIRRRREVPVTRPEDEDGQPKVEE